MSNFFETNKAQLDSFTRVSSSVGARADYVQGGGGNTSAKLAGGLMAIKASGYCLKDIRPDRAYAVLDYEALRRFYNDTDPAALEDVEKTGMWFDLLLGDNLEGRKNHISEFGAQFLDLADIS